MRIRAGRGSSTQTTRRYSPSPRGRGLGARLLLRNGTGGGPARPPPGTDGAPAEIGEPGQSADAGESRLAALASRLSGRELGGERAHVTVTPDGDLRIEGGGVTTVRRRFVAGQARVVDHTVGSVNLGAELRIAEGAALETATPAIAAALSELHALFRSPSPGITPPGATPVGPVNGVQEIGNLTGGHVVIGSFSGTVFLQQVSVVGSSLNTNEPPPGPASSALPAEAESSLADSLGPDRIRLGDVSSGDIYIESVTGAIVVSGEVRNPAHLMVIHWSLVGAELRGMDVVGAQLSISSREELDAALRVVGAVGSVYAFGIAGAGNGEDGMHVAGIGTVSTGGLTGVQLPDGVISNFNLSNMNVVGIHVSIGSGVSTAAQ